MLDVLTAIVISAATVQTDMVRSEPARIAAEAARTPLVSAPAKPGSGSAPIAAGAGPQVRRAPGPHSR